MKKIIFMVALVATTVLSSCGLRVVATDDEKPSVTEKVSVAPFSKITIMDVADVHFTPSDTFEVKVVRSESMLAKVYTKGNTLYIKSEKKNDEKHYEYLFGKNHQNGIDVYIKAPTLSAIAIKGTGEFSCERALTASTFTIGVSGEGDVDIHDIKADTVKVSVSGVGDVEADVREAKKIAAKVSGSGDIEMDLKQCGHVTASVSGVGRIKLNGDAESLDKKVSGVGSVHAYDLKVKK